MITGALKITLRAPWSHSLKEKRAVVKSICGKASAKFNIAIAEVDDCDALQLITIGIACVTNDSVHCDSVLDNTLKFIENNTEAEIIRINKDRIYS